MVPSYEEQKPNMRSELINAPRKDEMKDCGGSRRQGTK
jgi:hypothetical protein